MGKASRLKKERRLTPPPVGKQSTALSQRAVLLGTVAAVVAIGAIVGVLLATRSSPKAPPPASSPGSDKNAPAALVRAADALNYQPTVEPGVGQMEGKPASAAKPPSNPTVLAVGTKAPLFTLKTPEGTSVTLSSYRGKAVLLEFFATWCPHCAAEAPQLRDIFASVSPSRYAWVAVDAAGEDAAHAFAYHRYFGLTSPVLLDPGSAAGALGRVSARYHVADYPTLYIIDGKGRIAWRSDGEQPDALIERELHKAAGA